TVAQNRVDEPRACDGAAGRIFNDALFADLGSAAAALDPAASDESLAGHPLRLEQHVHLAYGDYVATLTEGSSQLGMRGDHVRHAHVVEDLPDRSVVQVALAIERGLRQIHADHEPVAVIAE